MAFKAAIGTLSVKIGADTSDARRGIKSVDKQLSKSGKALKRNEKDWKKWGAATKLIVTGVAVLATRELIRYSDALTSMTNKLKLSTNSTKELAAITKTLFDVSKETRTSVESTVDLYAKMERATRNLDISQTRLVKITESINKAFAISGATAQETRGSIRQLGQALASGALRGDEFNSIAEQAPIIMEAVREATGKTAGELRELAATGAITAEILIESLERYADKIDTDFAQATATFGQKLEVARNNAIEFVGANDSITDSVAVFGDAVLILSENLDVLIKTIGFVAVVIGAKLIGPLIATKAALIGTRTAALAAAGGFTTMAGAATLARTALAFLGGPVGVAILAATALFTFIDSAETASEKSIRLAKEIDNLVLSFEKLTKPQIEVKLSNIVVETTRLTAALADANERLTKFRENVKRGIPSTEALGDLLADVKTLTAALAEAELKSAALFQAGVSTGRTPEEGTGERLAPDGQELIDLDAAAAAKRLEAAGEALDLMFDQEEAADERRIVADQERAERLKAQKLKQAEDALAALNQQLMSEQELEKFFHQQDLATAQMAFDEGLISKEEQNGIIESLEEQHKQRLNDIEFTENEMKRQIFERDANKLLSAISVFGKNSLKIQKAVSLAQAAVAIHTGIAKAQELGFPANIAEIARVVAVGVSAIRGIKSAKPGSATAPSAPGGGGGAGGAASGGGGQAVSQPPTQQINRTIDVRFFGQGVMSQSDMRAFLDQLNELLGDGGELNIPGV